MRALSILAVLGAAGLPVIAQPTSVVNSPHNLSVSGPGGVRASVEDQICIFCHAPHNSSPVRPLWNRAMPSEGYTIYSSRSLTAEPGQPTGMSKMCLSCHDGTIALGSVLSRTTPIAMAGGLTTIPDGPSRLGTDLSDDHPISFRFDTSIPAHNPKVRNPSALPSQVKLDADSELQCTSCHDAHNNSLGKFLVMRNDNSELCLSCHQVGQTSVSGHSNCSDCHQPHSAPSGPYLLRRATVTETCNACHDGKLSQAANIASEIRKFSTHDTGSPVDPPEPVRDHTTCIDCHEPHTMMAGPRNPPSVPANFGRINGVSMSGGPLTVANEEHEVCFKCHADGSTGSAFVSRVVEEHNARLEFSTSGISFHPVAGPGRGTDVPSLLPGWQTASRTACTDCHGSDTGVEGNPRGIHGSRYAPNLVAEYQVEDYTTESAQAYALCYQCHDRANILGDRSFKEHRRHIVDQRTPCAACHDAHGISSLAGTPTGNTHLINFATSMVRPNPGNQLRFVDKGSQAGQCFLSCHGVNHNGTSYP